MQSFILLEEPLEHAEPIPTVTEEETAKLIAAVKCLEFRYGTLETCRGSNDT